MLIRLNDNTLIEGAEWLAQRDPVLARVQQMYGYPPLWAREPGFSTLVHIILEQQVSLASANAAFARLREQLGGQVHPAAFLALSDETLRAIGFSRQKTQYARALADMLENGRFSLENLHHLPDDDVKTDMKRLKGIGDWTADIYLSECLMRPDILPKGDIAMLEAFKVLYGLDARPGHDNFVAATEHWRPWRSIGACYLWHFYLQEKKR